VLSGTDHLDECIVPRFSYRWGIPSTYSLHRAEATLVLSTDGIAGGNTLLTSGTVSTVGRTRTKRSLLSKTASNVTVAWLLLLLGHIWRPSICYACGNATPRWELPPDVLGFVDGEYRREQASRVSRREQPPPWATFTLVAFCLPPLPR
jgi:hypothetical protein